MTFPQFSHLHRKCATINLPSRQQKCTSTTTTATKPFLQPLNQLGARIADSNTSLYIVCIVHLVFTLRHFQAGSSVSVRMVGSGTSPGTTCKRMGMTSSQHSLSSQHTQHKMSKIFCTHFAMARYMAAAAAAAPKNSFLTQIHGDSVQHELAMPLQSCTYTNTHTHSSTHTHYDYKQWTYFHAIGVVPFAVHSPFSRSVLHNLHVSWIGQHWHQWQRQP